MGSSSFQGLSLAREVLSKSTHTSPVATTTFAFFTVDQQCKMTWEHIYKLYEQGLLFDRTKLPLQFLAMRFLPSLVSEFPDEK